MRHSESSRFVTCFVLSTLLTLVPLCQQEFYIPTESSSVHFLKSKLCVGCTKGFEIVDLETLDTQGLLDPADSSLDFVQKRETARPIAIYRIEGEFLLCYDGPFLFLYQSYS